MASKFVVVVLGLFLFCSSVSLQAGSIPTARAPRLYSAAVIVQDQRTGEFLLAKKAETVMPIASITKLMRPTDLWHKRSKKDCVAHVCFLKHRNLLSSVLKEKFFFAIEASG